MEYSDRARLGYEFESIIADIFRSYEFTATLTDGRYYDIDVVKGEIKQTLHEDLVDKIRKWEPHLKENTLYEKLCTDVIKYLFDSDLALWKEQQKSNDRVATWQLFFLA